MSTRDLERLARAVKSARLAQYPSRLAAAQAADISKDTWKRVEEAKEVRDGTYIKLERALKWPAGSCESIAEGAEPPSADGSRPTAKVTVLSREDVDESVRGIVQLAAIATAPALTGEQIQALSDRITKDLRESGKL